MRDQYHQKAIAFLPRIRSAAEVWVTEAVLIEVGNALSVFNRAGAVQFIQQCYHTANIRVVSVDTSLLIRALQLYQRRPDKTWGVTDCISFIVMEDQGLRDAVTVDQHFHQAGFHAILLENG
jgi:predicted nucleic acid-binding protein